MPPPGFIIGMILAAVAVGLIILRTRSHRELVRSGRNLRSSQQRLLRSQALLGNSLEELAAAIKLAQAKRAEKDAASPSASEPPPAGASAAADGPDGTRCSHCGAPTTATRPPRIAPSAPFARIPTQERPRTVGYSYARRRRKIAGRRL